jgi:hypothetical protein
MRSPDYFQALDDAIAASCYGCRNGQPLDEEQPEIHQRQPDGKYVICGSKKIRDLKEARESEA